MILRANCRASIAMHFAHLNKFILGHMLCCDGQCACPHLAADCSISPSHHVIHLRRADGLVPVAELVCGAIATSAPNVPQIDSLAQPISCIIDPFQGEQWKNSTSVMVAAPSCVIADALTKVAALAGPACLSLLAKFGAQGMWA